MSYLLKKREIVITLLLLLLLYTLHTKFLRRYKAITLSFFPDYLS